MDIFTVNRDYKTAELVQEFESVIWTERYYGDSEVELTVPMRRETLEKLPLGILIGSSKSDELMVLEEGSIEEGSMKYTGIAVLPWLNNRFVRYSMLHRDKSTPSGVMSNVGAPLWNLIWYGASDSSPSLTLDDGTFGIPFGYGHRMMIPGLGLRSIDAVPNLPESEWFTFTMTHTIYRLRL